MTILSIIIPAYNEENTLAKCVERVMAIADKNLQLDVIIIDDASTDKTATVARELSERYGVKLLSHEKNQGKGAALRTGFTSAKGDIMVVQDADLEYDPMELKKLAAPIIEGRADVVYGSRYLAGAERQVQRFWHYWINQIITTVANIFTNRYFTDVETCYKIFKKEVMAQVQIKENRFGFDPEMPISYNWRTHDEGKKIGWKDGFRAIYAIVKYSLTSA